MSTTPALGGTIEEAWYRAPVQASPLWPSTDPDVPLLPDPTAPTLSRFLPVYRGVLARTTGRRDGRG